MIETKKPHEFHIEPITLVVTCFNEERSVPSWARSFLAMNVLPQELIVADAKSTDNTVAALKECLKEYPGNLVIIQDKCNIAAGRNKAIALASYSRIAVTDFGVTFHSAWLGRIGDGLEQNDWVGGVYELVWKNSIQRSFCRLFNTPPQQLDTATFLPSSRSFGVTLDAFKKVGGYNESLVVGEDTDLVIRLKKLGLKYGLIREAIVYWIPRSTIKSIYLQNFRYAYWDGVAKQNAGRWMHVAFCAVLLLVSVLSASVIDGGGLLYGLLAVIAIIFIKTTKNTLRSGSGLPRTLDLIVYTITLVASSVGYIAGLFSSIDNMAA